MKKTLIRLTSLFLLLVMLASAVACAESGSGEDTTAPVQTDAIGDTAAATEPETTEINAENILGPADFGGETLLFYSRKYNGAWSSDLIVKEEDGTIVNNAIYRRNAKISALYNCNIEQIESGMRDCLNDFVNVISSGDSNVGAAYLGLSDAATAAQRGYLYDMTQLDNINLEGEWWTQSLNKAWSIGGAQYFATGVITTIDDQAIRTMFFNKDIIEEHNLKTIYALVDDNECVYEKFF
jgi:ABC-type glycerol-3-phosphate transport system substrate-binding protein